MLMRYVPLPVAAADEADVPFTSSDVPDEADVWEEDPDACEDELPDACEDELPPQPARAAAAAAAIAIAANLFFNFIETSLLVLLFSGYSSFLILFSEERIICE